MSNSFTSEEIAALKQFRLNISDIIEKYDEYDAHDNNLIRWLRARDLNLKKAESMIRKSTKYREEHPNLATLQNLPPHDHLLEIFPIRPVGLDKQGLHAISAQKLEFRKLVFAGKMEEIKMHIFHVLEVYFRHLKTLCTVDNMKYPIVFISDLTGFSVIDHISKPVISFAIELIRLFDLNYPEIIKTVYVINVPKIFPIGWKIISPFLSQWTLSKIKILGGGPDNWKRILLEDIDYRELPSEYGGSNTAHPERYSNVYGLTWPPRATPFPPDSFLTTVVPAKEKFQQCFQLSVGNRITWNFKTDSYDIGFEVLLNGVRMFPYAKADAHKFTQDGLVDVTEDGTYSLVFDNTYSKYRAKTLHYAILVENNAAE